MSVPFFEDYEEHIDSYANVKSASEQNGNVARDKRQAAIREALAHKREQDEKDALEAAELNEREILFIEAFVTTCNYDPRRAALEAGYTVSSYGFEVIKRPRVLRAIDERMHFEKMEAPEVVNRVAQMFRADLRHFLRVEKYEEDGKQRERVVVDLLHAMKHDNTYPLKKIEFYRSGEIKSIAIEDRLEAAKLIGAVFGLFGVREPNDDDRPFDVRARELGHDPKMVMEAMIMIAKQRGYTFPKELIEGQVTQSETVDASA